MLKMYFYIKISVLGETEGKRICKISRICRMCPLPTELLKLEETSEAL